MTDEQRQRIHAITYSTDDRAELAERIVALEDENKKLRDKNMLCEVAKRGIRACYDNLSEQNKELESENAKLRKYVIINDNTKLRELVRDMWDAALHPETFGDGSRLLMRMRDLGIEVEA